MSSSDPEKSRGYYAPPQQEGKSWPSTDDKPGPSQKFTAYAWLFLAYMLGVIVFGAWVRITGSGAGCGAHWPTCHGQIIPPDPTVETIIEYTHRLTAGILGPMVLLLIAWAWKRFGNHPVFWASIVTAIFIVFESLIGAGLVLAELVADDDSVARAVVISIHLVNTLMLTGSAALVAWWSTGKPMPRWSRGGALKWLLLVGLVGLIATSMSGAITALGDTLFPVDPTVGEGIFASVRDDLSTANHFLVRLRILHPAIAVVVALYLMALTWIIRLRDVEGIIDRWADITLALVIGQTLIGVVNIMLAAPGWLQLIHLAAAQLLWMAALFLTLATMMPVGVDAGRNSRQ